MSTNFIKICNLPEGERLLWQGGPTWHGLALRAFHVKSVVMYFAALLAVHGISSWWSGADFETAIKSGAWLLIPMASGPALLALLAWLTSRSTHYTITNKRVLIRFGIALPITLNIPFRQVSTAALKSYSDGTGDIPLSTIGGDRLAYILLWPHVRPWHFKSTEPMLRGVPDAMHVASILAAALKSASGTSGALVLETVTEGKLAAEPAFAPAAAAA